MRRALCLLAVVIGGCGGDDGPEPTLPGPAPGSAQERAIRGWNAAVNRGDYELAGRFFAPGAVVEQVQRIRLRGPEDAERFSRSLPCRADVTDVDRDGATLVAAFRLRPGPGPSQSCRGDARVRFRFRGERFSEWRQLPPPAEGDGDVI